MWIRVGRPDFERRQSSFSFYHCRRLFAHRLSLLRQSSVVCQALLGQPMRCSPLGSYACPLRLPFPEAAGAAVMMLPAVSVLPLKYNLCNNLLKY